MSSSRREIARLNEDPFLRPYLGRIEQRRLHAVALERRLTGGRCSLEDFASGHEYFGLHHCDGEWSFAEWAPNAEEISLVGTFTNWGESRDYTMNRIDDRGVWQITLPRDALRHGDLYRLKIRWRGGEGDRIPAYARRVVQDERTKIFNAQVWHPPARYEWKRPGYVHRHAVPLIYEAHPGMAQEREGVGTFEEFRTNILPRIADAGYNTIQLMAVMEHPYYASFGYHVSSFFAVSSRFGTPEDFKALIDDAHVAGISVIMDLVHSHAVNNEVEGLSLFDGTPYQYFHEGSRGRHVAWDSRCFDYGKPEVLHFLLSNCRFWLDEYRLDGFRFDGITSMMYHHHGLGPAFDSYEKYFDSSVDHDAVAYLALANQLVHTVRPDAITVAEDVSGMPGLAAPIEQGGCGFDYRLAMGVPDCWFKLANDVRDEDWSMSYLWRELTNRRADERTVSYVESHDQALVGGKSMVFELIDAAMYDFMRVGDSDTNVERGIALHKMSRLITLATAGDGYLNFMGNEFGHPEWVDFPREGNGWSYHYARRRWSLRDRHDLKYSRLAEFDKAMIALAAGGRLHGAGGPRLLMLDENDKTIVCGTADLFFAFNFHPSRSLTDYPIEAPPGEYELAMDTDEGRFDGHERLRRGQRYLTRAVRDGDTERNIIRLYLPCRTALVLRRLTPRKKRSPAPGERPARRSKKQGTE